MPVFRLVTYNIHKAVGLDRVRSPERVLDVLDEIAADVAVLQEADARWGRRASALPLPLLHAHGWRVVPVAAHAGGIGWHGNTMLVRGRLGVKTQAALALPAIEPRGAIMAELILDGALFRLAGMHLDLSGLARRRQARHILARLAGEPPLPTVIAGDLNEWRPAGGVIRDFGADHLCLPLPASFPARRPLGRLDRIFAGPGIAMRGGGVHASPLARVASDHLPVWADLALGDTA